MKRKQDVKRRLNFISGEDFYFLTYELLILIDILNSAAGVFKDHRKLAYLIELAGDENIIRILERYQDRKIVNADDREKLFATFANGEMHKREIYKLMFALERRGYLQLKRAAMPEVLDVEIIRSALPLDFLKNAVFKEDRDRATRLKKVAPRLSSISMETFLEKIYGNRGVNVWAL